MNPSEMRMVALQIGRMVWSAAGWTQAALLGEFEQKRTVGHVVFDAVISMFPIAGELTAGRDAVAILLRLSKDEKARGELTEWVSLVLCLMVVVPVVGGVLKGVGKLLMRSAQSAEEKVALCREILALLRKAGVGNPAPWLKSLRFQRYTDPLLAGFETLVQRLTDTSKFLLKELGGVLPPAVKVLLGQLPEKLIAVKAAGVRMLPEAIRQLDAELDLIRLRIVEGTWTDIKIGGGVTDVMAEEARLYAAVRGRSLGHSAAERSNFTKVDGWMDLSNKANEWILRTFAKTAPIEAIIVRPGSSISRVIDKKTFMI